MGKMIEFELDHTLPETGYYCTCCKHTEIDHSGKYVPASDYEALEAKLAEARILLSTRVEADRLSEANTKLARLVDAAECALTALNIASRQLTEDMKCVLNGKRWGGMDIDRLKAAVDAAKGKP